MSLIPGYRLLDTLHESESSIVYRAERESDDREVALKLLNQLHPSPDQVRRFRDEFKISQYLQAEHASGGHDSAVIWSDDPAKPAIRGDIGRSIEILEHQRRLVIVMEYCHGQPLGVLLRSGPLPMAEAVGIVTQVAALLARLHESGVVHKDVNPSNLIYDRSSGLLRLIDFGIAGRTSREATTFYGASSLLGTPAYLSPEQTGRMNRSIDYRTDFYSLGVTFYEFLTGVRPFQANDLIGLLHCHIAKTPEPPEVRAPNVPAPLSRIVLKLMAKNPEDRYQSASLLQFDLERRLDALLGRRLTTQRASPPDVVPYLHITERLIGRERELERLHSMFAEVKEGTTRLVLISGQTGVGKTRLVKELYQPITARRGNFVEGKFELLKRDVPYAAFIQAFRQLAVHMLTESEAMLETWRRSILDAIAPNAGLIIDLIPEFEAVLGPQTPVPELTGTESQNRFKIVLQGLVSAVAGPEHPLVLFLDDLQWADGSTFDLLESLIDSSDSRYLMLVGAYRGNEVDTEHRLSQLLRKDDNSPVTLAEHIELSALSEDDVQVLVAETLGVDSERVRPLAEFLHYRTDGNPFFVGEYLRLLYDRGALTFDAGGGWQWVLTDVDSHHPVGVMSDLVAGRIGKLSTRTQDTLNLAACIGKQFSISYLARLQGLSREAANQDLTEALDADLIQIVAEVIGARDEQEAGTSGNLFRFVHDQIQSAAYQLAPLEQRRARHRQIGEAALLAGAAEAGNEALFDLLYHLNQVPPEEFNQTERDRLAELNLRAAHSARATAAFEQCLNYARNGLVHLRGLESPKAGEVVAGRLTSGDAIWDRNYQLSYDLFLEAAQAAVWNLEFALMDESLEEILQNARNLLDRVRALEVRTVAYISRGQLMEGIQTGLKALSLLGVTFPEKPVQRHVALGYVRTRIALLGRSPESLRALPTIRSEELLAVFRILREIDAAVFLSRPDLFPLTVFKQVQLSIRHGNTAESAAAYCTFGLVLGGVMGNFKLGTRFGQLALGVLEDFDSRELYPRVHFLNNYFIRPWTEPFADVLDSMLEAHQVALRVGDFEYGAYLLDLHLACGYHSGSSLESLNTLAAHYVEKIGELGQERTLEIVKMRWQAIRSFIEPADEPWKMVGSVCDSQVLEDRLEEAGDTHGQCDLLINRLILCFHFYELGEAAACLDLIEQRFGSLAGEILMPLYYFYCPLVLLSNPQPGALDRASVRRIQSCRKQLRKWAASAPANYGHKHLTVEALFAERSGDTDRARDLFDRAIYQAQENGYEQEHGLVNELAGTFHLRQGRETLSGHYLREARYAYERWGATRRVAALLNRYPEASMIQRAGRALNSTYVSTETGQINEDLDAMSVIRSSQIISSEIQLDRLLINIMRIAIENAGAQYGALLLERGGTWYVEATAAIDHPEVEALCSEKLDGMGDDSRVPVSLVRFVIRTQREVLVDNVAEDRRFQHDPYVLQRQPASMLCMALIRQQSLIGVLYLENRTTNHAFGQERLDTLRALGSQAAISIENAHLFAEMEALTRSQERFVPNEFLQIMERANISEVDVGQYVARTMTVLFCDLRQFTPLSEKLAPDVTIAILNRYFDAMEQPIREHGGFIDAFTGDEIMVLFDGLADRALRAAEAMHHALKPLNKELLAAYDVELAMGIGINTGRLLLGTIGGQERIKCGVVGDTVNLASRIESLTKEYDAEVLIGENTYESLERPDQFQIRRLEKVRARGKSKDVMIYQVVVG